MYHNYNEICKIQQSLGNPDCMSRRVVRITKGKLRGRDIRVYNLSSMKERLKSFFMSEEPQYLNVEFSF
jgi:hypothetical protein